ncbi:MAG: HypC/HybG/HupF family hydrogenase formation chaperone [Firmicutes bacterium]|nr:HypC/HybG/HupF family hydrogenase formation chaperone [Bacillota bacterium]
MCLGIPGLVVEVLAGGEWAIIETFGLRQKVGLHLVGKVVPGDYLMVHAGYAIEKIDLTEAGERIRLWEEMLDGPGAG